MLIAQKRRKENIVEYLLYMWQIEDLIRANQFDINLIDERVIAQYGVTDPAIHNQMRVVGKPHRNDAQRKEGVFWSYHDHYPPDE